MEIINDNIVMDALNFGEPGLECDINNAGGGGCPLLPCIFDVSPIPCSQNGCIGINITFCITVNFG